MKVYPIPDLPFGRLAIAGRPRGGDWLVQDLSRLASGGWTVLVSALERSEEQELDLVQENSTASRLGMRYVTFPIPDRGLPEMSRTLDLLSDLRQDLVNGGNVAVHCRMGIGRSSLLCSALIVTFGMEPETIWSIMSQARGVQVPDTVEQYAWLSHFRDEWSFRQHRF